MSYVAFNIIGIAMGIWGTILVIMWQEQEMTFDEKQSGATPIEIFDYLRGVIDTLRAEKALLEKRYKDLEASRETWQKLAQAWELLADNKGIVPADEA